MQVAIELFYNALSLVAGTVLIRSGRMSPVRHPDPPSCVSCRTRLPLLPPQQQHAACIVAGRRLVS